MGFRVLRELSEGSVTGVTTDDYVVALTLDSRYFLNGTIAIKNTHSTATLSYKITGYANYAGTLLFADVSEADIAAGASATYERNPTKARGKITISVKSKVSSTPAAYLIEYIQIA